MADSRAEREPCGDVFAEMQGVQLNLGGRTVLDYVDLTVRKGELLALVGANGAGKSSLLRCLAGLWHPQGGTIRISGLDRFGDDLAIRRFTAYLPPEPALRGFSIRENLRLFAEAYGVDEKTYCERTDALLRMFDLKERQNTNSSSLSKGELKKACLAAVFLTGASFYILDEPFTGGIDPRGHAALRRVLDRLAARRRITAVFATQIPEIAVGLADRIAVVNYGRILAVGTADELREAAHLPPGTPFTEAFEQLASRDTEVPIESFLASMGAAP
jgi:ABC-type multidrug transport system ATPase subunit